MIHQETKTAVQPETSARPTINSDMTYRAEGCLIGQLAGDALASMTDGYPFWYLEDDKAPDTFRPISPSPGWGSSAGQPIVSELALVLAGVLAEEGLNAEAALSAYKDWYASSPPSCSPTMRKALTGAVEHFSPYGEGSEVLTRTAPIGIWGAGRDLRLVAEYAALDARLTHPHPLCEQASALLAMTIARAIKTGQEPAALHEEAVSWAGDMQMQKEVQAAVFESARSHPADRRISGGHVLFALSNAFWQLLNTKSLEAALIDTVKRGGETLVNTAVCGALMGAAAGRKAIPEQWQNAVLGCRLHRDEVGVCRPRPEKVWPSNALGLVEKLVSPALT